MRKRRMGGPTLVIVVGLALALGGWLLFAQPFREAPPDARVIDPADAELVALGAEVYAQHCASCHGADLEGQPDWRQRNAAGRLPAPPHDPSGHTWHHSDPALFKMTKYGPQVFAGAGYESDMPAYEGKLTDREIRASIAYIKSRWPAEIRERQAEITRRALEAE